MAVEVVVDVADVKPVIVVDTAEGAELLRTVRLIEVRDGRFVEVVDEIKSVEVGADTEARTDMLELVELLEARPLDGTEVLLPEFVVVVEEPTVVLLESADEVDTELVEAKEEVTVEWLGVVEMVAEFVGIAEELTVVLIKDEELRRELLAMMEVGKVELVRGVGEIVGTGVLVDMEAEIERQEQALERRDIGY